MSSEDEDSVSESEEEKEDVPHVVVPPVMDDEWGDFKKKVKATLATTSKVVKKETKHVAKAAWNVVEPPPIRYKRMIAEHIKRIAQMDSDATQYFNDKNAYHEIYEKEINEAREELFARRKRIKDTSSHSKYVRAMREKYERLDRQRITDQFNAKNEAWRLQDNDRLGLEKEAIDQRFKKHLKYKRELDTKYWKEKSKEASVLMERQLRLEEDQIRDRQEQRQREVEHEEKFRRQREIDEEMSEPVLSSKTAGLGIFGTPLEPGEYASQLDGGYQAELDAHTIGIPTTGPHNLANELRRVEFHQQESGVQRLQEFVDDLATKSQTLMADKALLEEKIFMNTNEINQLDVEEVDERQLLAGPPRREPNSYEIEARHLRKTQRGKLKSELIGLKHRMKQLDKEVATCERQRIAYERQLKPAKEKLAEARQRIQTLDETLSELPAIVGTSLNKPGHTRKEDTIQQPTLPSTTVLKQVELRSKFEILKAGVEPTMKLYQEARRLKIESWKVRGQHRIDDTELQRRIAHLADVKDRLFKEQKEGGRADLNAALRKFQESGQKLRKTYQEKSGTINWWLSREASVCSGVICYGPKREGVAHGACQAGVVQGTMRLPAFNIWNITLRVSSIFNSSLDDNGDNSVKVFLGNDKRSLNHIGVYRAKSEAGEELGVQTITCSIVGAAFSYRFEFKSNDTDTTTGHMAIVSGRFDAEAADSSLIQSESKHMLSDFVKMLRIQQYQASHRTTSLLEELVRVEGSRAEMWDSRVLHGHDQRFKRLDYAKQLRAAIKDEIATSIDQEARERAVLGRRNQRELSDDPSAYDEEQAVSSKLELSMLKQSERRREGVHQTVQKLFSILGHESDVHDQKTDEWMSGLLNDIRVEYHDNDANVVVHHKIQMLRDDGQTFKEKWRNLRANKYALKANQSTTYMSDMRLEYRRQHQLNVLQQEESNLKFVVANSSVKEDAEKAKVSHEEEIFQKIAAKNIDKVRKAAKLSAEMSFQSTQGRKKLQAMVKQLKDSDDPAVLETAKQKIISEAVMADTQTEERFWKRRKKKRREERFEAAKVERSKQHRHLAQIRDKQEEVNNMAEAAFEASDPANSNMTIPGFELALPAPMKCNHQRTKAWGSKYATGVKCFDCGKELSRSFMDPDHTRGSDPELDKLIEQHRDNEGAFRFKDSEELARVEQERLRLEKEAREIELGEQFFYDRDNIKCIQEINRRHGICSLEEKYNRKESGCRQRQERHAASFREELGFYGRINQFRNRISRIVKQRVELNKSRMQQVEYLDMLHTDRDKLEKKLNDIMVEHVRSQTIINKRKRTIKIFKTSRSGLKQSLVDRKEAHKRKIGVVEDADVAEHHANCLVEALAEMKWRTAAAEKKKNETTESVREMREQLEEAIEKRDKSIVELRNVLFKQRNIPIRTPYGKGVLLYYREEDDMLVVKLNYGKVRAYVRHWDVVRFEEGREQQERIAMEAMDAELSTFYKNEREKYLNELTAMREEEKSIQKLIPYDKLRSELHGNILRDVCEGELQAHAMLMGTDQKQIITEQVEKEVEQIKGFFKENGGTGLFKRRRFRRPRTRRACRKRLEMQFVEQFVLEIDADHRKTFETRWHQTVVDDTVELFVDEKLLHEILTEVCEETQHQDNLARERALNESGIAFNFDHLPFAAYDNLQNTWIREHRQLTVMNSAWAIQAEKLEEAEKQLALLAEAQRVRRERRKRLEEIRREMREEEMLCRRFYRAELALSLEERRKMRETELEMKEFLRQEQLEILRQQEAGYNERQRASEKEARRLEIKRGKQENKRLHREWADMKAEDQLSSKFRDTCLEEERQRILEESGMRKALMDDSDGDLSSGSSNVSGNVDDAMESDNDSVESPKRSPVKKKNETAKEKRERLRREKIRAKKQKLRRAAAKQRAEFRHKIDNAFAMKMTKALSSLTSSELQVHELRQRVEKSRYDFNFAARNYAYHQEQHDINATEVDELVATGKEKRAHANKCLADCKRTDEHVAILTKQVFKYDRDKFKVIHETATMDTSVLHTRPQRFDTFYLNDRLHTAFFESIVMLAVVEAQTIVSEREAMALAEKMQRNAIETKEKTATMKRLWVKNTRKKRMRLFRSELGKLMFTSNRSSVLKKFFTAWVRHWTAKVTVSAQYDLRYSLLLHQNELDSLAQIKSPNNRSEGLVQHRTLMEKHNQRWLECRHCKKKYSDVTNHRSACCYHPGTFVLACIKSCQSRQGETVLPTCIAHRTKRWLCCDSVIEGSFGSSGCQRRHHMPPINEAKYAQMRDDAVEEDIRQIQETRVELDRIAQDKHAVKAWKVSKDAVRDISDYLDSQRDIVKRFATLRK